MPSSSKWLFPLKWIKSNTSSFFNSFSASKCFALFELIFWLRLFSLSSKSVFVTKLTCFYLAAKFSAVSLLNSGVVIYLPWSWSVSVFSMSLILLLESVFSTKLLTLGILISTAVNIYYLLAELVAIPL